MKKIKLQCWWTDSVSLMNRFIKQFVFEDEQYAFVDSNPDFTIVFGKTDWDTIETPKERTFYFSQEPMWSPNEPKDGIERYCSKIFVSDKRNYPDRPEYIEILLPMFYAGRGEQDYREEWDWSKKIFYEDFSKEKNNEISVVVTNSYNSHLFQFENKALNRITYKDRVDTVNKIIEDFPQIHIWGTFQPNNNINCHGEAFNKLLALRHFKFSICFENTIQKNYISEKFWDAVLTDTIPIYFGCENINDYISNDCYINLTNHIDDYGFINDTLKNILENSNTIYASKIENLKKLKEEYKINKTFNLWEKIKSEIKLYD